MIADSSRRLELLAPARDAEIGRQAIIHGADAVYIGPLSFGARAAASNSVADIARLCDFAHRYRARVYATVNTILYDSELIKAERLIRQLYHAGVDALIVQDMGILRLDIPPIELHASTQCDIRTPEKARFLQDVGFSQIVLARELTINEIERIHAAVNVQIEAFVHGALCVSYSGRCHASQVLCGRSANRGECAQICRLPYSLIDASGRELMRNRHLLSLHDLNASSAIYDMVRAGVSSFKIEGRLKDSSYVKNVTAYYRRRLDEIIIAEPESYIRGSDGEVSLTFVPAVEKSFNRGFTSYFLYDRKAKNISSPLTPKSLGEPLHSMADVHNGDGLSFFMPDGTYTGFNVNGMRNGFPIPNKRIRIPQGTKFYRTTDIKWQKFMSRADTAQRRIAIDISLFRNRVELRDERGLCVTVCHDLPIVSADQYIDIRSYFEKLGNTIYWLREFHNMLPADAFVPASALTKLRRTLIDILDRTARVNYKHTYRRYEDLNAIYPHKTLDYKDNVANRLAVKFYETHGIKHIEPAVEINCTRNAGRVLMTTRHCILRDNGLCLRDKAMLGKRQPRLPLYLHGNNHVLRLSFDCERCEMQVILSK